MFFNTIHRYIFKMLCTHLLSISVLVIGMVWFSQSLRFLELIVNNNIGLQSFIYLILFLLPDLISMLLPLCLLVAGLQVYQKLIADNEIIVLRGAGYNNYQIGKPFFALGILLTAFSFASNVFLIPESFKKFRAFEYQIKNELSASIIQPGTFNAVRNITVYVQKRNLHGQLKGIFIHHPAQDGKNAFIVTAQEGQIVKKNNTVNLLLYKGNRQEWDQATQKLSFFYFDNFVYDLNILLPQSQPRPKKPYERTLNELLHPNTITTDQTLQNRMYAEAHQRMILPWLCFVNSLVIVAIIFFGDLKRRTRKRKLFVSVIVVAALQVSVLFLLNLSAKKPGVIGLIYVYMFLLSGLAWYALRHHHRLFLKCHHIVEGLQKKVLA
ncbi:MAG: LptF/LptG family permease [Alphaproteobacteria bacterium]|nr:LptF/LptG family permease [Alphaproteobacteria bacterium]